MRDYLIILEPAVFEALRKLMRERGIFDYGEAVKLLLAEHGDGLHHVGSPDGQRGC